MPVSKAEKKERILSAAYDLFLEKGYTDTKIIDIAERAKIGKGTVYEYFDSKESLFSALFLYLGTQYKEAMETFMSEVADPTPLNLLRKFLHFEKFVGRYIGEHNISFSSIFLESSLLKSEALVVVVEDMMNYQIAKLAGIVEEGVRQGCFRPADPFLAATAIIGGLNFYLGALTTPRRKPETAFPFMGIDPADPSDKDLEEYLQFVLKGLDK